MTQDRSNDAIITSRDLARQREEFALDGYTWRPYHYLAAASANRGQPWDAAIGLFENDIPHVPDDRAYALRRYRTLLPFAFIRTDHRDADQWAEACRQQRSHQVHAPRSIRVSQRRMDTNVQHVNVNVSKPRPWPSASSSYVRMREARQRAREGVDTALRECGG